MKANDKILSEYLGGKREKKDRKTFWTRKGEINN